ncbi:MAG TPA: helix-turn-helix domain-containing protein [Herpetosiphonaceae bacterium]|nr:helix-turn-helix domain-containing protein [Herpetosiphonaceae bacterium]
MLDIEAAATCLGVSVSTVRRLVRTGDLPAFRVGRQLRFRPEEIDAYIESRRIRPLAGSARDAGHERVNEAKRP